MNLFRFFAPLLTITATAFLISSCGKSDAENPVKPSEPSTAEVTEAKPAPKPGPEIPTSWTEVKLHAAIRSSNPNYTGNGEFGINPQGQPQQISLPDCGIESLDWLKGMPLLQVLDLQKNPLTDISQLGRLKGLQNLYLESTGVTDVSPLAGMRLDELYLTGTPLKDISPLKTMAVNKLNLVNTPLTDLTPLAGVPIQSLWLTDTPVKNISGLEKVQGLVSVTLHRTLVEDLSPLANGLYPQGLRLHIGETPVTDLTPLAGVPLNRLVFTPKKITKGLDKIRQLPIREIGTTFDDTGNDLLPYMTFWPKVDAEKKAAPAPAPAPDN